VGGDVEVRSVRAAREQALDTVRELELHLAGEQANSIRRAGEERAAQIIAQARTEAAALVERRCAAANRLADLDERDQLAETRAQARGTVLRAQQSVLTEVRAAVHTAVSHLVGDPRLERLLERLAADARERLASADAVQIEAAPGGGFVARAGHREIDCSLHGHVDRFLDAVADELEDLGR
jgi:vacuolar-type H+-ATPase subunit E/Vma4